MLPSIQPTLTDMLVSIAGVSQPFFQALDSLVRNGISTDRISHALNEGDINLPMLLDGARRLNEIDARRTLQVETAERILDQQTRT